LQPGTLPFPMPFCFSDGLGCANFNQLVLACDERWDEAKGLLADGVWPSFFGAIGRVDLIAAARQAASEPDRDVALSQLLEKFPADGDVLRRPKVAVASEVEDLGTLTPGKNHKFDLLITNRGMLVLRGMVMSECDWLSFGDRASGPSLRMFQTRSVYALPVRVLGDKLRAGRRPLEGEIVIDTNGGAITLPVRANVPIQPFPAGVHANDALAGATSPHELAVKARAHPQEAAILFEQGAVRSWYAANGWTYPIEGAEGSGKGAVQQFFEALGLTKPPLLEISTDVVTLRGKVGESLLCSVTVRTREAKPVYARAWSNQDWVRIGPTKYQGNKVKLMIEVVAPPCPGETVQAQVTIQGNGKQMFYLPVNVTVDPEAAPAPASRGLRAMFQSILGQR
jgi:hypothetical protein